MTGFAWTTAVYFSLHGPSVLGWMTGQLVGTVITIAGIYAAIYLFGPMFISLFGIGDENPELARRIWTRPLTLLWWLFVGWVFLASVLAVGATANFHWGVGLISLLLLIPAGGFVIRSTYLAGRDLFAAREFHPLLPPLLTLIAAWFTAYVKFSIMSPDTQLSLIERLTLAGGLLTVSALALTEAWFLRDTLRSLPVFRDKFRKPVSS